MDGKHLKHVLGMVSGASLFFCKLFPSKSSRSAWYRFGISGCNLPFVAVVLLTTEPACDRKGEPCLEHSALQCKKHWQADSV